jgi:hypothetical protein
MSLTCTADHWPPRAVGTPRARKLPRDGAQRQPPLKERLDARQRERCLTLGLLGVRPHARCPRLLQPRIAQNDSARLSRPQSRLSALADQRTMLFDQALELDRAALALDEALERRRSKGVRQRIVVERVNVAPGAQVAIGNRVGAVTAGGPR